MSIYKFTYLRAAWLVSVLILLNTSTTHAATPPCGSTLTSNTTLDSNMICPSAENSRGLLLSGSGSDNVIIDCAGYSIKTSGRGSTAISASDVTGVTIKNCNIETDGSLAYGISVVDSSMSEVSNNTVTTLNTFSLGIQLQRSSNILVDNNTVSTTGISSRGINLRDNSSDNVVTGNTVTSALSQGVRIRAYSDRNTISQNSIESGTSQAVRIESSSNNTLSGNTFVSPLSFVVIRNLPIQNGGLSVDGAGSIFAVENNFGSSGGAGGEVATMAKVDSNTGETISTVRLVSGGNDLGFGFDSLEIMSDGRFLATRGGARDGETSELYEINPVSGEVTLIPLDLSFLAGGLNGLQATGANTLIGSTNQGELLSIDLDVGTGSPIGKDGNGWTDLAMHPTSGELYTLSRWSYEPSGTSHLYQIDPTSGDIIKEIGDTGEAFVSDIDFSTSGTLYANSGLYTIDESTGVATYIGGFGPDPHEAFSQNNTLVDQTFTATTEASVQFSDPLDLPPSLLLSLDSNAIQLGQNSIFIDSALYPFLDVPARITFENLGGSTRNLLVDFDDDGTFEPCEPPQCTLVSFTGGTLIFDVTGFSTYSSEAAEDLTEVIDTVKSILKSVKKLEKNKSIKKHKKSKKFMKKAKKHLQNAIDFLLKNKEVKGNAQIKAAIADLKKVKKKKSKVKKLIKKLNSVGGDDVGAGNQPPSGSLAISGADTSIIGTTYTPTYGDDSFETFLSTNALLYDISIYTAPPGTAVRLLTMMFSVTDDSPYIIGFARATGGAPEHYTYIAKCTSGDDCSGVSFNRATMTATLTNVVLPVESDTDNLATDSITLNGAITFSIPPAL